VEEARRVSELSENPQDIEVLTRRERIDAGVFYTHGGLTRGVLKREFRDRWNKYQEEKFGRPE
jgi:hypothetical protein